jgi:TolB-like protein/DNA-binding winged helix-turn-helix (wHTH) protein/Flp pilus assembly protein TadD
VSSRKLRFDGWVLDPESGDLERGDTRMRLQEQPVQVLRELISHAGSVVTREQLIALLWPKGVVDFDTGLNTVIRKLRSALGDTSDTPRYIETLPRRGYRFIGTLDPDPETACASSHAAPVSAAARVSAASASAPASHPEPTGPPEAALGEPNSVPGEREAVPRDQVASSTATTTPRVRRLRLQALALIAAVAVAVLLTGLYALWRARPGGDVTSVRVEVPSRSGLPANVAPTSAVAFSPSPHSIAVLPFVNMSSDKEQEYFADGLADELLDLLSKIPGLHVIARTSSFSFKGTSDDIPSIAAKLKVTNILEGSVRKSGTRLRVSAQLVRAADGEHLWSETYDRELTDIFRLQDEIAAAVVRALKLKLSVEQEVSSPRRANVRPVDQESYEKVLLGRYYWNKGDQQDLWKSIEFYRQALAKDPQNALAQAGLADAYSSLSDWYVRPHDAMPEAKAAAMKALELDGSLWAAHNALCFVLTVYELNWSTAEHECRRAIELNPNSADAHDNYGMLLAYVGRVPEATEELRRAEELDPLSYRIYADGALAAFLERNYQLGTEQARRSIELAPEYFVARGYLALIHVQSGRNDDAVAEAEKGVQLTDSPIMRGFLAYVYAATGRANQARQIVDRLILERPKHYVCAFEIATTELSLGETDQAFRWFETAYDDRSLCIPTTKFDPRLDPVRSDRRYLDLIRRIGFPAEPTAGDVRALDVHASR